MPTHFVQTRHTRTAFTVCRILLKSNRIAFFDGPPGTGKTTTAAEVAAQVNRPVAMITLPFRPAPLDVLRRVIYALSGIEGTGTKYVMEDEAVRLLTDWQGLLIVDEVQNCGAAGIQTLRYLHDQSRCTFALLLVGWQALKTVHEYPDLESRVLAEVRFRPLTGDALFSYLDERHPELAGTPEPILRAINDRFARGNLREWRNFVEAVEAIGHQGPLTADDVDGILGILRASA